MRNLNLFLLFLLFSFNCLSQNYELKKVHILNLATLSDEIEFDSYFTVFDSVKYVETEYTVFSTLFIRNKKLAKAEVVYTFKDDDMFDTTGWQSGFKAIEVYYFQDNKFFYSHQEERKFGDSSLEIDIYLTSDSIYIVDINDSEVPQSNTDAYQAIKNNLNEDIDKLLTSYHKMYKKE